MCLGRASPSRTLSCLQAWWFHITLRRPSKRGCPSNITTDFYKHVHDDLNVLQPEMNSGKQWFPFEEVPQDSCDPRTRDHERLAKKLEYVTYYKSSIIFTLCFLSSYNSKRNAKKAHERTVYAFAFESTIQWLRSLVFIL